MPLNQPCVWCRKQTSSPRRVCNDCVGIDSYADHQPEDADALTGGRWVIDKVRRIQVWEWYFPPFEEAS